MSGMTLTEFLLARIAEDKANASDKHDRVACNLDQLQRFGECVCDYPARVLAECEAKRGIVGDFEHLSEPGGLVDRLMLPSLREVLIQALRHLALPYADHPDYREEWKP